MRRINIYYAGKLIHSTESESLGSVRSNILVAPEIFEPKLRKIVISGSWGEFSVSDIARTMIWNELKKDVHELDRDDPILVRVVEALGEAANGETARLKIVEVPEEVNWKIEEHDGKERVIELTRSWG
jgi:dephospho-CoA kinase